MDSREEFIKVWKIFLVDCFTILDTKQYKLEELRKTLNSLHPNITFTMETSNIEIPFLDVLVKKNKTQVSTDIFHKATDSKQYLSFDSCHPTHIKKNVPYAPARRIRTKVSDDGTCMKRMEELKEHLQKRKYPKQLIETWH